MDITEICKTDPLNVQLQELEDVLLKAAALASKMRVDRANELLMAHGFGRKENQHG